MTRPVGFDRLCPPPVIAVVMVIASCRRLRGLTAPRRHSAPLGAGKEAPFGLKNLLLVGIQGLFRGQRSLREVEYAYTSCR